MIAINTQVDLAAPVFLLYVPVLETQFPLGIKSTSYDSVSYLDSAIIPDLEKQPSTSVTSGLGF